MTLQELRNALASLPAELVTNDMDVVVELVGDEFEDGELLVIDNDVAPKLQFGKIIFPALSNTE